MLHPNSLFGRYKEQIRRLETVDKETIQTNEFILYQDPKIQIYYAPHNEFINEVAKIFIVGITPGLSQTKIAYQTAKIDMEQNLSEEKICFDCKMNSRFAGTMRRNLISMLDELCLNQKLELKTVGELFNSNNSDLHTTSLIKYPCFHKEKNYNGHTPAINSIPILKKYIQEEFMTELSCLKDIRLIIPLGTAVENILKDILGETADTTSRVLWGFPHPSGLNGRRISQFAERRQSMLHILETIHFG